MNNVIYMVIPCYNEQEVLNETAKRLFQKFEKLIKSEKISHLSRIIFTDDGSKDKTWEIIEELIKKDSIFGGVKLSRNRGHQNALLGGMLTIVNDCDAMISMDADLQDDIDAIDEMVEKFLNGSDIVYGVRNSRKTDTFFKKFTAQGFYKLMNFLGAKIIFNHADFRLMSKRAVEALSEFPEVNLFLRGMVPMVGFSEDKVYYERHERFAGESKYPLKKMLAFAFDGITSFSVKPIRFISTLGLIFLTISGCMAFWGLASIIIKRKIQSIFWLFALVWAMGGVNLLSLGMVGEYVGKIYMETKKRPRFIIEKYIKN